jgi:hypothetical protein
MQSGEHMSSEGFDRPAAIRRRRRWLMAFALLGLAAIVSVAAVRMFGSTDGEQARLAAESSAPSSVVLERFELMPPSGGRARGLAELVRRGTATSLRMIAVQLKPSLAGEVYQVSLVGGPGGDKLLGGEIVGGKGTFLARAVVSSELLHRYRRIEMRRIGTGASGAGKLVLGADVPR